MNKLEPQEAEATLNAQMVAEGQGRHLPHIINEMLKVVPADETSLRSRLQSLLSSARHAAPEAQGYWWDMTANILASEIGEPVEEWQQQVTHIFIGEQPQEKL